MNFAAVPDKVSEECLPTEQEREALLQRLMTQYGDALLRMAYLYLRDAALAEDAVQETFVKAYMHLHQFRGESTEKSWLMRIAINTCKDFRRTAWLRLVDRRKPLDELPEPGVNFCPPDDTVLRAVMRLPERDKQVILLRYYQDMKIGEIGDALGLPEPTVASRLRRARDKLHRKLERWYFDE